MFMGPRFLRAVEIGFERAGRFRHLIAYDGDSGPVGWASSCAFPVDLGTLATAGLRKGLGALRKALPRAGRFTILFVGLPVSLGQNHLALAPGADVAATLGALDDVLVDVGARDGASFIIWKDFTDDEADRLAPLLRLGYRRADLPPMHEFPPRFPDFASHCEALRSNYRKPIRRSLRKFERAGLNAAHLRDPEEILRVYTPEAHRLYEAVVARSSTKLEVLPREFFRELVQQFPGGVSLTVVRSGDRIVAFNWALFEGATHHFMFCGIDYSVASESDLYFNLMYRQLDDALRLKPATIKLGQTADVFKARLGCVSRRLHLFVKPCNRLASVVLRSGFQWLFPAPPPPRSYNIYRAPARHVAVRPTSGI